jgi:aspartate carbamoyltransferase catalytic subunit
MPKTKPPPWSRKHLTGLEELEAAEITALLDTAAGLKDVATRKAPRLGTLAGKVVVCLFFEPSTRTSTSFGLAAKRLSADVVSISSSSSSAKKGETLKDTARNVEAMGIDVIVVRHSESGAPHRLARAVDACVVNAGDGAHEHPTQALLDIMTLRERRGKIEGLKVAIVGDIRHSRVARSNIWGLTKLGAEVTVIGPPLLVPGRIENMGAHVRHDFDAAIDECGFDAIMMLRIQLERQGRPLLPSLREYTSLFGLDRARLDMAAARNGEVIVMHPGPINRGVEMTSEVADGDRSVILDQVTNGIAVRMAVLSLCSSARDAARGEARA